MSVGMGELGRLESYLLEVTITTRFALKIDTAQGTRNVLLTVHLVGMQRVVIFEVEVANLAVVMFGKLVRL